MRHLDLFSGIGGFALATEMVFGDVEHIFCDNDPFSQAILKKHWPNSLIYGDIKELSSSKILADSQSQQQQQLAMEWESNEKTTVSGGNNIDLLTGGFPCQPFSQAGARRGTEDDRHLWPEMLRVIRETKPTYIVGENVSGFATWNEGMVLEQVCSDLEAENYEVRAFAIPAAGLNAPHKRERIWIVAHSNASNGIGWSGDSETNAERMDENKQTRKGPWSKSSRRNKNGWRKEWFEVAASLCPMDDGLPNGLARPRGWRNAALKGAGNAIVPQVAAEIMRGMINIP